MSFIAKVVTELLSHGFAVHLHNKEHIDGYGGWFGTDIGEEEFVVAMKHHMGFEILLHEYCHFLQWKHDRKFWDDSTEFYDILFDWVADKNLNTTQDNLNKSLYSILAIEHDCEKRAISIVQNTPIENFDLDKYIRAVNAYLWSYHINKEYRTRPKNPIYSDRVLEHMPNVFYSFNYYLDANNLTKQIKNALLLEYELDSTQG